MDALSVLEDQQQREISSPGTYEVATVLAMAGGSLTVDCSGLSEKVQCTPDLVTRAGDTVVVLRSRGRSIAVARGPSSAPQPGTGTVTAVPGGSVITVTPTGGTAVTAPFLASYPTPAVADSVALLWTPSGPLVLGKLGTAPVPVVPPIFLPPTPTPPPAPAPTGLSTFSAIDARSYRNSKWRTDSAVVAQDDWGGYGTNYGAWFYGTRPGDTLAGVTVTGCRVRITRRAGGDHSAQTAHIYRHGSAARPAGAVTYGAGPTDVSIGIGQQSWVDLPAAWGQAVVDSGAGLGIQGSPYVVLKGLDEDSQSGLIEITWSR